MCACNHYLKAFVPEGYLRLLWIWCTVVQTTFFLLASMAPLFLFRCTLTCFTITCPNKSNVAVTFISRRWGLADPTSRGIVIIIIPFTIIIIIIIVIYYHYHCYHHYHIHHDYSYYQRYHYFCILPPVPSPSVIA